MKRRCIFFFLNSSSLYIRFNSFESDGRLKYNEDKFYLYIDYIHVSKIMNKNEKKWWIDLLEIIIFVRGNKIDKF